MSSRHCVGEQFRVGGLDLFAVGTDRFALSLKEELDRCVTGGAVFKALRGDFGCGKSFTARWYQQQALARGFAVAEVQISENDTPLHRLETVYRRAMEGLRTAEWDSGAFRAIVSQWLMGLEEEVSKTLRDPDDLEALAQGVGNLLEARLKDVSAVQPQYAAMLRAYYTAVIAGDHALSEGLIAWLMGQPNDSGRDHPARSLRQPSTRRRTSTSASMPTSSRLKNKPPPQARSRTRSRLTCDGASGRH